LYATRRDSEFSLVGERVLPRILEAVLDRNVDYHSEFIDFTRFTDPAYQAAFHDFLSLKYHGVALDLVIAMQDQATQFVRNYRDSLFAGIPVVFLSNTPGIVPFANSTGLIHERDFGSTLGLIRQLQPDLERLFVVTGAARADQAFEAMAQRQFQRAGVPLEIVYLSGLSTQALVERLSRLPKRSAVYYMLVSEDGDGKKFHPLDYVDRVAQAANAPTYCWVDSTLGRGIVGGNVYSQRQAVERVGTLALRVLRGQAAESIPPTALNLNSNQVDWRQLRRWGIDESRVPAGTSIRFRDPTIWDRYKHYIVAALALLLTQTALITGLLIHRKRRRKAEDELRQSQNNLRKSYERNRDLGARLLKAQETERSRIARELHDDICQRMLLLTIGLEALTRANAVTDSRTDSVKDSDTDSDSNAGEMPARDVLTAAQDISRSLHELSHRLHPERLRTVGLATAVGRLCAETSRAGIPIQYTHENVPPRLSSELMLCLFRIAQESLQNAIKYSNAKAVSVRLASGDDGLTLSIVDDGVGFDVEDAWGRGVGLVSMVERLEAIGGSLEVNSHPGGGARLTASVPPDVIHSAAPTYDSTHSPH
jgi:signal transduction histidine kinase